MSNNSYTTVDSQPRNSLKHYRMRYFTGYWKLCCGLSWDMKPWFFVHVMRLLITKVTFLLKTSEVIHKLVVKTNVFCLDFGALITVNG